MHILGALDTPDERRVLLRRPGDLRVHGRRTRGYEAHAHRLRLPAFNLLPRATVIAQRDAAARLLRRPRAEREEQGGGSSAGGPASRSPTGPTCPTSSRAARCSGSPSPGRSSTTRRSSSRTSPPATSTPRPGDIILETFERLNERGPHHRPHHARAGGRRPRQAHHPHPGRLIVSDERNGHDRAATAPAIETATAEVAS